MLEKQHGRNQHGLNPGFQKSAKGRSRRRYLLGGLALLLIVMIAAGCGPKARKGFIKGEAFSADGTILAGQKLLVNVAGRSHIVTTAADGSFEINDIALGTQEIVVSYEDLDTGQQFQWQGVVQVGIQGAKIRVEFAGNLEDFHGLVQAAWRQIMAGEWETAKGYLESLEGYSREPQQESICELAWGWLYLRSGMGYETARQHFQKALALGKVAEAQVGLAGVETATGRHKEAITYLEQALEGESNLQLEYLDLNTGDLEVVLANLFLRVGDDTKALEILNHQTQEISVKGQQIKRALLGVLAD
jgi:tetratricopeptide (TPR) repeat protein